MSQLQGVGPVSGFVFRVDRDRGPQWYAKWREPGGRQVKRRIGPAWTGRGRPDPGFFTKRTAEEWLRVTLAAAEVAAELGVDRDVTFATAAAEWLRYVEHDRAVQALDAARLPLEADLPSAAGLRRSAGCGTSRPPSSTLALFARPSRRGRETS